MFWAKPSITAALRPLLRVEGHFGKAALTAPQGMVWIPGKEFLMGSESPFAKPNEVPAHKVGIRGFWMDRTPVANAEFAIFVAVTGYVTSAECAADWETLKVPLSPGMPNLRMNI
jgi:sulfatase modifying factor 1